MDSPGSRAIFGLYRCRIQHALQVAVLETVIGEFSDSGGVLRDNRLGMMQVHLVDCFNVSQPRRRSKARGYKRCGD